MGDALELLGSGKEYLPASASDRVAYDDEVFLRVLPSEEYGTSLHPPQGLLDATA